MALAAATCGCPGTDDAPEADAGSLPDAAVDAAGPERPAEPEPPASPAAPELGPCPAGWTAQSDEQVVICEPWGATGRLACEGATAQWPGAAGCEAIGSDCPDGDLPEGLPPDATILWVQDGAPEGATGLADDPFGTIGEALGHANAGEIVAIGRGTYDEAVRVPAGVTLWGACPAETTITSSTPSTSAGVVTVGRSGAVVRNLRVSGERVGVWADGRLAEVELRDVVVESARGGGLWVSNGGRLVAERVVVRDTRDLEGVWGLGLEVDEGSGELRHAVLERNAEVGVIAAAAGASVVLEDVAVVDTRARTSDARAGYGLMALAGGTMSARRTVIASAREVGVVAVDPDTTMTLEDVVVRDTIDDGVAGRRGRALFVDAGAQVSAARLLVERSGDVAIRVAGTGAAFDVVEMVVQDSLGTTPEGEHGSGLSVQDGARASVAKALVRRTRDSGVVVIGEGTFAHFEDLTVSDTTGQQSDGRFGRALSLSGDCEAEVLRARFERGRDAGVLADGEGTILTLEDVAIADNAGMESDGSSGFGVILQNFVQAEFSRISVERTRYAALGVIDGARLTASDVVVRDTDSQASDGTLGRGLSAQGGASVELQRGQFVANRELAVAGFDEGTTLRLEDVLIADTSEQDCGGDCGGFGSGIGVGSYLTASIDLQRFSVVRSALCGVQVARDGGLDLRDGEVAYNPVGANVQVDDYDISRLTESVAWRDNQRDLDSSTTIPLPRMGLDTAP